MKFTEPALDNLINLISRLPGLGPKSARRIALYLLKNKDSLMKPLAETLSNAHSKIIRCQICGAKKTEVYKKVKEFFPDAELTNVDKVKNFNTEE